MRCNWRNYNNRQQQLVHFITSMIDNIKKVNRWYEDMLLIYLHFIFGAAFSFLHNLECKQRLNIKIRLFPEYFDYKVSKWIRMLKHENSNHNRVLYLLLDGKIVHLWLHCCSIAEPPSSTFHFALLIIFGVN